MIDFYFAFPKIEYDRLSNLELIKVPITKLVRDKEVKIKEVI